MARLIHYEIFVRRGASPGWILIDAVPNRAEALAAAQSERDTGRATAARVMKETYDEATGEYQTVKIFEDGAAAKKVKIAREEDEPGPVIPCLTPDDLYSSHARATLHRLFADTLARWRLTVTELIHRPDSLERLEATGTIFQHAVQKVALAQASGPAGQPVVATIRALNDLADRAIQRVYREQRAKRIPACESPKALADYAVKKAAEGPFAIGLAFAAYLAPATGWMDKLDRTLAVIDAPPPEGPARDIVLARADDIVGEILAGSAALAELIGPMSDLGHALIAMSDLYLGRTPAAVAGSCLAKVAAHFAAGHFLAARTALARRVLSELRTHKKLAPSIDVELLHLRAITSRLVLGPPRLMPHDDIVAAVTVRSRRLVNPEIIGDYLKDAATPVEKAERLLGLEENVVGAENKRRLWEQLSPILVTPAFEVGLMDSRLSPMDRVARAAEFQQRILRSSFAETAKAEGAATLDAFARRILDPGRLTPAIDHAERGDAMIRSLVQALLGKAVPQGESETAARAALRRAFASGALLRVLTAGGNLSTDAARVTLEKLGLIKPKSETAAA